MTDRIVASLLLLGLLDRAQVSDALDLVVCVVESLLRLLVVDHFALGLRVLDTASLLLQPAIAHAQVRPIQVVLRNLRVVVENGKLVVLLRLQTDLLGASLPRAQVPIVLLLDALREVAASALHVVVRHRSLLALLRQQLLVKGVLLLANRVDPVKVVHVLNRARTAPLEVIVSRRRRFTSLVISLTAKLVVDLLGAHVTLLQTTAVS